MTGFEKKDWKVADDIGWNVVRTMISAAETNSRMAADTLHTDPDAVRSKKKKKKKKKKNAPTWAETEHPS